MNNQIANLFNSVRVNEILQSVIQDPRLLPAPMVWGDRIPDKQAPEEEIMARFYGTLLMADLVADDAVAGVYDQGTFQFESNKVPNIKTGVRFTQAMINVLNRLQRYGGGDRMDQDMFDDWQLNALVMAMNGVEQRKEMLRVAMLMDGMNYNRLGIKMSNVTWGMYQDLKITVDTDWSNPNALGLTDLQATRRIARVRYNKNFNRYTCSTAQFLYLTQQTQFIQQARTFGFGMFNGVPAPAIPLQTDGMLKQVLSRIITGADADKGGGGSFEIEIDDRRAWSQDENGVTTNQPYQPVTAGILTDSADDGNTQVWDFAQGVVTESVVASLLPYNLIGPMEMAYGPIAYVTAANAQLNPAGLIHWAVDRGFPRRKQLQCSACLRTGNYTDPISTSVIFPA